MAQESISYEEAAIQFSQESKLYFRLARQSPPPSSSNPALMFSEW